MILGIAGTLGSGKGTVVSYLVSQGFIHYAVSDTFLVNEARARGREPDRQARHDIANEYRAQGPTTLMEAVVAMARRDIEAGKDVIIEPQHSPEEVRFIQSLPGKVIGVDADIRTRYERIQKRGSAKDNTTFEAFQAFEALEMHPTPTTTNNLAGALEAADVHVYNNGTVEELHAQIDKVLAQIRN